RRRDPDAAVHRICLHVACEVGGFDLAVHGSTDKPHVGGDTHREIDRYIVVVHVHVSAVARFAGVLPAAVARVHGADRDAVLVLHDLDLHLAGVAPARVLHGGHLDVARAGHGADVAVYALDLDRLARGHFALPMEFVLG